MPGIKVIPSTDVISLNNARSWYSPRLNETYVWYSEMLFVFEKCNWRKHSLLWPLLVQFIQQRSAQQGTHTAQCRGENRLPENFLKWSCSRRISTHPSWPERAGEENQQMLQKHFWHFVVASHHQFRGNKTSVIPTFWETADIWISLIKILRLFFYD